MDCVTWNLRNLVALFSSLPLELFWLTGVNSVVPTALQSLLASLTPESAKPIKNPSRKWETHTKKNSPESCLEVERCPSFKLHQFHSTTGVTANCWTIHRCIAASCVIWDIAFSTSQHFTVTEEWFLRFFCEKALIIRQQQYIRRSATPILSSTSCKSSCKSLLQNHAGDEAVGL